MKQLAYIILFMLPFIGSASKAEFKQANQLYDQELYHDAIEIYEGIVQKGAIDASLYFNLANAYYRTDAIAPSILYYEKALKLDPNNEKYEHNLVLANQRKIDKIEPLPEFWLSSNFNSISGSYHSDTWAMIMHISLIIALFGFASYIFINKVKMKKISLLISSLCIIISIIIYILGDHQYEKDAYAEHAIVYDQNVYVKSAPSEKSNDVFILHEGTKLKILDEVNDWINIKIADGKSGWIPSSSIVEI